MLLKKFNFINGDNSTDKNIVSVCIAKFLERGCFYIAAKNTIRITTRVKKRSFSIPFISSNEYYNFEIDTEDFHFGFTKCISKNYIKVLADLYKIETPKNIIIDSLGSMHNFSFDQAPIGDRNAMEKRESIDMSKLPVIHTYFICNQIYWPIADANRIQPDNPIEKYSKKYNINIDDISILEVYRNDDGIMIYNYNDKEEYNISDIKSMMRDIKINDILDE